MRIKPGFELRTICGEHIIIAHGLENIDFTKVISLNESAADVWNAVVGKEFTVNDMTKVLLDLYEVDEQQAAKDAEELLKQWKNAGFIQSSL